MLLQRVVTALVLLAALLAAIWFIPTPWLYATFGAASLLAAWEWAGLMGLARGPRAGYVVLTAALLGATWLARAWWPAIMAVAGAWWVCALFLLRGFPENLQRRPLSAVQMGVIGQVLILPTILALATLHGMPEGALKLLFLLFLVFAADTGAYLAGRNLGRNKLAPKISPGKTIEGAIGGLVLCALWTLTAGIYAFGAQGAGVVVLLLLSMVVAVVSIVGDLTESMFKRMSGVKDSGALLPGHGGLLDRIDSILAAAPVMALGLWLAKL